MIGDKPLDQASMRFKPESAEGSLLVDGYGDGGFRIGGARVEGGVVVTANGVFPLVASDRDALTPDDLKCLETIDPAIELILFGMGRELLPLPRDMRLWCKSQSLGFDLMDSGAAARTYNILQLEGRRVAAVLLPV